MTDHSFLFLLLTVFCVFAQGFFSMFEMACVSFNKIRLQYYESKNNQKAIWLKSLINKPSKLFGTALICISTSMQIGSEASRKFYESIGVDPDFSPITQIFIVLILGELAPLFAARKHAESIALFSTPIVYFFSKVLTPFIFVIEGISKIINWFFGKSQKDQFLLTREEIQKAFEDGEGKNSQSESENMHKTVSNIFDLKKKTATQIMMSLDSLFLVPQDTMIEQLLKGYKIESQFLLLYANKKNDITGIAYPRSFLRAKETDPISSISNPPWFITESSSVLQILKQFRSNNQMIAIVLNSSGKSVGYLTLDQIIDEIFGDSIEPEIEPQTVVEKTLAGDMLLEDFNKQFHANLYSGRCRNS